MENEFIIFLDIDGVLNSFKSAKEHKSYEVLDSSAIDCLDAIIEHCQAKVVISSSWRKIHTLDSIIERLEEYGFQNSDKVIDITPSLPSGERQDEILKWREDNSHKGMYLIIDDDVQDLQNLRPHLIKTTFAKGLLPWHIDDAIRRVKIMIKNPKLFKI